MMPDRGIFWSSLPLLHMHSHQVTLIQEEEPDGAGEEAGPVLSEEDLQYVMTEEHMQPGG